MVLPEEAAAARERGREVEAGSRALAAEVGENGEAMVERRGMGGEVMLGCGREKEGIGRG